MRGEAPIKYVLKGDREAGKRFMRRGAVLMGMLEHDMSYQSLKQCVMRRWVTPDVLIECDCRFGLRTVTITVAPVVTEHPQEDFEDMFVKVVVAVSTSKGVFMHYGDWKRERFTDGRLQWAHHTPIPDGYIPREYAWSPFYNHYRMTSWANWGGTPRASTLPRKFADAFYSIFIGWWDVNDGYDREDARYAWSTPSIMPGFTGKDYLLSHNIIFAKDDERIKYYHDHLRLSELTVQQWTQDGRQEPTTKWIYSIRGFGEGGIASGPLFDIAPMPMRNNVRRFVALPVNHDMEPAIFCHVSVRSQYDLRHFKFTEAMLKPIFPADLEWDNRTGRGVFQAQAYMDDAGIVHVCFALAIGDKAGTEPEENIDVTSTRWITSMVFVTIPALPYEMTPEDEQAFILENMTVRGLSWDNFLPLLDLLHAKIGTLPGGRYDYQGTNSILTARDYHHCEDGWYWYNLKSKTKPEYTIDGVVHNAGKMQYDIARCYNMSRNDGRGITDEKMEAFGNRGIAIYATEARYVLSYALGEAMPADSVIFHSGAAAQWYSWTRMWGGLSIKPEGLSQIKLTMPPETEADGVKPEITWAGNGLFCCVCFDTCTRRVLAAYIGTPFDTAERDAWWQRIPLVSDEWAAKEDNAILLVRPALATMERVVLLAILREGKLHYAAYCDGSAETARLKRCGVIPLGIEDEEEKTLDICDFGKDEFAELLKTYPSPPRAVSALEYSNIYKYDDPRWPSHINKPMPEFAEEWHDLSEYN